jgi:hypothetical protein
MGRHVRKRTLSLGTRQSRLQVDETATLFDQLTQSLTVRIMLWH